MEKEGFSSFMIDAFLLDVGAEIGAYGDCVTESSLLEGVVDGVTVMGASTLESENTESLTKSKMSLST